MFYYVLTGVIIAYFSIIIFAGIEKLLWNNEDCSDNDENLE